MRKESLAYLLLRDRNPQALSILFISDRICMCLERVLTKSELLASAPNPGKAYLNERCLFRLFNLIDALRAAHGIELFNMHVARGVLFLWGKHNGDSQKVS